MLRASNKMPFDPSLLRICSKEMIGKGHMLRALVKNWPAMQETTCNAGDWSLTPGSGKSPGEENSNHSSILAWRIPWTEEPGELQSIGQESDMT